MRQHGNGVEVEVARIAAAPGFHIQGATLLNVLGNIGNVHAQTMTPAIESFQTQGIVMIASVCGIDADNIELAEIAAFASHERIALGLGVGFMKHGLRECGLQAIFAQQVLHTTSAFLLDAFQGKRCPAVATFATAAGGLK
jgi:hypothetical protein